MPGTILSVLRALIDAAFGAGSISDALHADLHRKLDAADPAIQNAPPPPLSDVEQAELERLTAKQSAAAAPAVPDVPDVPEVPAVPTSAPYGGTETGGFGG